MKKLILTNSIYRNGEFMKTKIKTCELMWRNLERRRPTTKPSRKLPSMTQQAIPKENI